MENRVCLLCGAPFTASIRTKVYCSRLCTIRANKRKYDKKIMKERIEQGYIPKNKNAYSVRDFVNMPKLIHEIERKKQFSQTSLFKEVNALNDLDNEIKLLQENSLLKEYSVERRQNPDGQLRYYSIFVNSKEFLLDKKGFEFFKAFSKYPLFVEKEDEEEKGYLARKVNDKKEFFHREFKKTISSIPFGFVVHHKNLKKNDNRNCNLQIMSEQEHKELHENLIQKKRDKAEQKYEERGIRIRERYERRGEKMRERYEERGRKMRERYERRGESFRKRFHL